MFVRNGEVLGSVLQSALPGTKPEPPKAQAPVPAEEPAKVEVESDYPTADEVETPPRNGSREVWAEFLDQQGIEYLGDPEEAGRNDLIAIWDNRKGGE